MNQSDGVDGERKNEALLDGFLQRAGNRLNDARQLEHYRQADAISAAQETIELSAKVVFLLLDQSYPTRHTFTEDEFLNVIANVPEEARFLNFPRLYVLHRFWASFYTVAKYGFETLGVPPGTLFQSAEANLAISHAQEWFNAANRLRFTARDRS